MNSRGSVIHKWKVLAIISKKMKSIVQFETSTYLLNMRKTITLIKILSLKTSLTILIYW